MDAVTFQLNKVRRLLRTQGQEFTFARVKLNEFGEPNGNNEFVSITGVYHETTSFLQKSKVESTTIRTKASPMILCLWEEAQLLQHTDVLNFNGNTYTISDVKNIAEANAVADISLEEVQKDGRIQA